MAAAGPVGSISLRRSDASAYARNCPRLPAALRDPDHRDVEHAPVDEAHQRGERLQLGEVAGGTEDHQGVDSVGHGPASARHEIRSRMWSPTRNAFAIAVSDGFTAPMLGKKLVSAT